MAESIPERDWKYSSRIKDSLLQTLCRRINEQAMAILNETRLSEHEKYLKLYRYIQDSDQIVADGFNDWRRSNLFLKLLVIKREGLLTSDQLQQLSPETQERLRGLD